MTVWILISARSRVVVPSVCRLTSASSVEEAQRPRYFLLNRVCTVAAAVRLTIKEDRVGGRIMVETQPVGGTISIPETATIRMKGEHDVQKRDKCSLTAVHWVPHRERELAS